MLRSLLIFLILIFPVWLSGCEGAGEVINDSSSEHSELQTTASAGSNDWRLPASEFTITKNYTATPATSTNKAETKATTAPSTPSFTPLSSLQIAPTSIPKIATRSLSNLYEDLPFAPIIISSPGPDSSVVSPILLTVQLNSTDSQILIIELRDQDGRLLARQLDALPGGEISARNLTRPVMFEIRETSEPGRLVLSSRDTYGRWVDVNSIELILNSEGVAKINPLGASSQAIVIQTPPKGRIVEGGVLSISGLVRKDIENPLRVTLVTEDGSVVGQRLAGITSNESNEYNSFATEIPYQVDTPTTVRLTVYEDGGVVSPIRHLSSFVVILNP